MRRSILTAIVLSALATTVAAQSPVPERRLALTRDLDFPGGDIRTILDSSLNACEQALSLIHI